MGMAVPIGSVPKDEGPPFPCFPLYSDSGHRAQKALCLALLSKACGLGGVLQKRGPHTTLPQKPQGGPKGKTEKKGHTISAQLPVHMGATTRCHPHGARFSEVLFLVPFSPFPLWHIMSA